MRSDSFETPQINSSRLGRNRRHFADDTFKHIFLNENVRIFIKTWLKFVPKGPKNNIPALVQVMAWCRPGNKPSSEPMMVSLMTLICVTRPQWVNLSKCWWSGLYTEPKLCAHSYHLVVLSISRHRPDYKFRSFSLAFDEWFMLIVSIRWHHKKNSTILQVLILFGFIKVFAYSIVHHVSMA